MRHTAGVLMTTTPEIGFYSAKDHPSPGAAILACMAMLIAGTGCRI
jgi:hypothetical protein